MKQKQIALVNGLWVGHHPIYVKTFVKILLKAGYQVSVFCPAPEELSAWIGKTLSVERDQLKTHYFADRQLWLWRYIPVRFHHTFWSLTRWVQVSLALRKVYSATNKPDLVFFAWLDCYLREFLPIRIIDNLFPFCWSGLYFHPKHFRVPENEVAPRERGFFEPPEKFIAQSRWAASIAVLDAGIVDSLRTQLHGKQAFVFPDFTDEITPSDHTHLVEKIRAKAKGRKVIGLLGGLSRRKGLLTLIRIVEQSVANDWCFVFAGTLLDQTFAEDEINEIKLFFRVQRDDCFFHINRIPDDAQFNAVVNACDVIFAMYEDFPHSSNLITKSAVYGKSVLVSTGGYMAEVVGHYKLGLAVPAGDVQAALSSLQQLITHVHADENLVGMKKYAGEQTQANLKLIFLDLIENSLSYKSIKWKTIGTSGRK